MQIKTLLHLLFTCVFLVSFSGCSEKIGGGVRGIVAGETVKESIYGIRNGKELGFIMFTDLPSEGAKSSAGSNWTGQIQPASGPIVKYEGDSDGLTINGTRYEFTGGRVFLVTTTGGTVSGKQLNIKIGSANFDLEIDSITKQPEIQKFLAP